MKETHETITRIEIAPLRATTCKMCSGDKRKATKTISFYTEVPDGSRSFGTGRIPVCSRHAKEAEAGVIQAGGTSQINMEPIE